MEDVIISHYRARAEHFNHRFNSHNAFHTKFRCGIQLLSDMLTITAHTTNVDLYMYPKYEPYSPWLHFI